MIDNKQTLSIIYNNWYAYQLGSPTPKQQDNFWQAVFETKDEQFIKEKILDADLDRVLIKYIEHIMRTQKMNEKQAAGVFEEWWPHVLSEYKPLCAHVLHSLLSHSELSSGSESNVTERLMQMKMSNQWDNVLFHFNPKQYPSQMELSQDIMQRIMCDLEYTQSSWEKTLKHLDVFLSKGGELENRQSREEDWISPILRTPLAVSIAAHNDVEKLNDLFKRGATVNMTTPTWPSTHRFNINDVIKNAYTSYFKSTLGKSVERETKRKI